MAQSYRERKNQEQLERALGKNIIGIGQIVSEEFEVKQGTEKKFGSYKINGVTVRRYKVRICHSTDGTESNNDLITVFGQSPTSGLRGEFGFSPTYPVNTYVTVARIKDLYYITEVHPNCVIDIPKTKEFPGCGAASGFIPGSIDFKVPQSCKNPEGSDVAPGSEVPRNTVPSEADKKQNTHNESIEIPSPCIPVDTAAINKELEGLIKFVEELRTGVLGEDSFLQTSQEFLGKVQSKVNDASQAIANAITWLINEIRKEVNRRVNSIVNNTIGNLYLNARYAALEANDEALSLISCLFLKILNNLANIIADFLNSFIDTFLNTGLCVIESLLSTLLGNIISQIIGAVNQILGALSNLLGIAMNLTNDILGFLESIIDLLSCDIEQLCPVTNEWNFLEGGVDSSQFSLSTFDFRGIFENAKSIAETAIALGEIPGNLLEDIFAVDLQSAIDSALDCVGLFQCGVPTVSFWGADGSGASGNAVVSAAGEILGINIVTPGRGYSIPPVVSIDDACGTGTGAYGTAVIGDYEYTDPETGETSTQTGVLNVIMNNPGYGYLPSPDGSVGGMGRTIANRCQSLIRRGDTKKWEGPFDSGEVIDVRVGDTVRLAGVPEYISEENTSVTAPPCPDLVSSTSPSSTYPVAISIGDVYIEDPGFGFSNGDTITITPDNGAELVPVIGGNGRIIDVNIVKPGLGFTDTPTLKLNTSTGYNATLIPILSFKRIGEDDAFSVPTGTQLVQVIDCVGKN